MKVKCYGWVLAGLSFFQLGLLSARGQTYQQYDLFPLTVGSSWTSDDERTTLVLEAVDSYGTLSVLLTNQFGRDGYLHVKANSTEIRVAGAYNSNLIILDDHMGYYEFFKHPVYLGRSWFLRIIGNGFPVDTTATVTSTNVPVTIRGYTHYGCTEVTVAAAFPQGYTAGLPKWVNNKYYYSPGIGCIKRSLTSDTGSNWTTQVVAWDIKETPEITAPKHLPWGVVGVAYSQEMADATAGLAPYSWAVINGALPSGLALQSDGVIVGTPDTAMDAIFTLRATGANGLSAAKDFKLTTYATAPLPLTITKAQAKLNFAKTAADSFGVTVVADLGEGFSATNKPVTVSFGAAEVSFVLDAKGKGISYPNSCGLKFNKTTGLWTLTVKCKSGSWQSIWEDHYMTNETVPKPGRTITVPIVVQIGDEVFAAEKQMLYTATKDKSGQAK